MDDLENLTIEEKKRLAALLRESEDRVRFNSLNYFEPYPWQRQFVEASLTNQQLLAMTGNRCGKTRIGAIIAAAHATGIYPEWWTGKRFNKPIKAWAVGASTSTTRDILQSELLGAWDDPNAFGTGAIPKSCIYGTVNRIGVPGAYEVVQVKHVSGGISTISFKSYEMSMDKFMGTALDLIWLDEEAPKGLFTQCITRTATTGGITYLTFTPEHGLTELVNDFVYDLKPGQFLITASWADAPHLDETTKQQLLNVYSPAEREMRTQGTPFLGSGVCFPINQESLLVDPFSIPDHWLRLIGIDLGSDHPNGVACVAYDAEADTYYLYDEYSEKDNLLHVHARAIIDRGGDRIPVQLPHDAFKRDGAGSGAKFIELYQAHGVNCVPVPFTNPPDFEGKTRNSIEYGVQFMHQKMLDGKFKVFRHCTKFLQELTAYHRKDGHIVPLFDDMISATRYAVLSMSRYGRPGGGGDNSPYRPRNKLEPYWTRGKI